MLSKQECSSLTAQMTAESIERNPEILSEAHGEQFRGCEGDGGPDSYNPGPHQNPGPVIRTNGEFHRTAAKTITDGGIYDWIDGKPHADMVNSPTHYIAGSREVIDIIDDVLGAADAADPSVSMCIGNAVKYLCRHTRKGNPAEDLRKARWYIDRAISRYEEDSANG